ncbi:MAG: response regulator, partial [Anaerolineales bacterium]|nr:response regulator [Anaerolineales bacterium]
MTEKTYHALLIEDNPADARLIREYLHMTDSVQFTLDHADRLASGLRQLAAQPADVVLLDLSLPDSHGWDTFSQVQQH